MRRTQKFEDFNDSQRHALDTGRNLAVRAGAGSGKTSVLVERIVQILARSFDEGAPIELTALAALTFTRKAAAELQERLRENFEELATQTEDESERIFWESRAAELPRSMIGTIDGFCARLIREFGHLAPPESRIEPDFEPLQGYDAQRMRQEAVDRLINQLAGRAHDSDDVLAAACHWWAEQEGYDVLARHLTNLLGHLADPEELAAAHRDLPPPWNEPRPHGKRCQPCAACNPAVPI